MCGHVVGGVIFYGSVDMQVTMLPQYRGRGYMSAESRGRRKAMIISTEDD